MPIDRFRIRDPDKKKWGLLVKKWIKEPPTRPRTLDELKAQCAAQNFAPIIPDYITGLVMIQNDKHVLTVRLPAAELVEAGEEAIRADPTGAYPLPDFYLEFKTDPPPDVEKKLELHAARIGEYSVNSCA